MPKIKQLVERKEDYIKCLQEKNAQGIIPNFEKGIEVFNGYLSSLKELQSHQSQLNKLSEQFNKTRDKQLIDQSKKVKETITELQKKVDQLSDELLKIEITLPNWIAEDVPRAVGDENEVPIKYSGIPKVWKDYETEFKQAYPDGKYELLESEPFHHYDLVGDLIDQEIAGNVAQSRFYYEFNELVPLDLAISMYALEFFKKKGYADTMMIPPFMMRKDIEEHITYFEAFKDTIFEVEREGLLLTPSSEHTIIAYYANKIFEEEQLPLRVIAWSPCFRREAGAHGKDTRGIFRVKQFQKVEIHSFMKKDEDMKEIYQMTADIQEFLDSLGLPNRSVIVPSGEMDKRALKQIDIETWMPGQGKYRETHSIATLDTWVSEKMQLRYRKDKNEKELVRNVYATAVAVQRIICAIAENHYDKKTKVIKIPEPLKKYTMGITEIKTK